MNVLVFGSTGGSGRAVVERLLAEGHHVTAFARRPGSLSIRSERLRLVTGDVMRPAAVARALEGHDAVVIALGISENPLRVRLLGPARTPIDVRSAGTRNVVSAMRQHGVRRLVVQTTYGVGATRDRLRLVDRLFFKLLLRPQIDDTETQNRDVSESELDWVIVQPVHLTDGPEDDPPFVSTTGAAARMKISRRSVARFIAEAVTSPTYVRQTVALSGQP